MSEPEREERIPIEEAEPMDEQKVFAPTDGSPTLEPPEVNGKQQIATRQGDGEGRFECKICKKRFNSKVELEMHMDSLHKGAKQKTTKKPAHMDGC